MVEETLQELASQLGTSVEYLWGIFVRLQRYEAALYLLQVLALAAWTRLLASKRMAPKWLAVESDDSYDLFSRYQLGAYLAISITALIWIVAFFSVGELIGLIDPEVAAAQDLLRALRGST